MGNRVIITKTFVQDGLKLHKGCRGTMTDRSVNRKTCILFDYIKDEAYEYDVGWYIDNYKINEYMEEI